MRTAIRAVDTVVAMRTTADMRKDLIEIQRKLRNGELSNAVARTLICAHQSTLNSLRIDMDAQRLGCKAEPVQLLDQDD